ncbi:MAG: hypothetical protein IJY29_04345 [Ruminococcus sp.]|nr:hypothetical protein [Ruminococcus sp.]
MGIFSIFKSGTNYFDKKITPKCEYCQNGKRTNAGDKILCEIKALVDPNYSCNKFVYSPLKRIPVKQLNSVGILDDESLYVESAGDRAEKEEESKAAKAAEEAKKKQEEEAKKAAEEKAKEEAAAESEAAESAENYSAAEETEAAASEEANV